MRTAAVLLTLALAAACPGTEAPDAKQLLKDSGKALFSQGSFRMENQTRMDMPGSGMKMTLDSRIAVENGKFRLDVTPMNLSMVSDGQTMYFWMGPMKQYMKKPAPTSPEAMAAAVSSAGNANFTTPSESGSSKIVRTEGVDMMGKKIDCYVVESTFDEVKLPAPPGATVSGTQTSWIDKDRHLVVKQLADLSLRMAAGAEGMKMHVETELKSLDLSPVFSADEFRFTPPEGAKEVDGFPGMPAMK